MNVFFEYTVKQVELSFKSAKCTSVKDGTTIGSKTIDYTLENKAFGVFKKLKVRLFPHDVIILEYSDITNLKDDKVKLLAIKLAEYLGIDSNGSSLTIDIERNSFEKNYYCWYLDENHTIVEDGETSDKVSYGLYLRVSDMIQKMKISGFQIFSNDDYIFGESINKYIVK